MVTVPTHPPSHPRQTPQGPIPEPRPVLRDSRSGVEPEPEPVLPHLKACVDIVQEMARLQVVRVSLAMRRGALWLAVAVLGLFAAATWMVASVWFFVTGLVQGGRALLPEAPWLGTLLVAALGLSAVAGVLYAGFAALERRALRKVRPEASTEGSSR